MNNLDKEYNNRFQYEKLPNDGFDVEGLWDAVEKELDKQEDRPVVFYLPRILGVLFLLLFMVGIGFWFKPIKEKGPHLDENLAAKNELESSSSKAQQTIKKEKEIDDKGLTIIKEEVEMNLDPTKNEPSGIFQNNSSINSIDTSKSKDDKKISLGESKVKNQSIEQNSSVLDSELITMKSENEIQNNDFPKLDVILDYSIPLDKNVVSNKNIKLESVNLLETKKFVIDYKKRKLTDFEIPAVQTKTVNLERKEIPDGQKNLAFELGISGGLNWNTRNYKNTDNSSFENLKNVTENGNFGQSFGLDIAVVLKSKWIIRSGIEYNNFWTKFDHTKVQTEQVQRDNQLLKIWVDGADTLKTEYGTALINETTTRKVIHHNQYSQVTIPFEIGMKNRYKKISYGVTVGTVFNFAIKQSGKGISESLDIIEYDNNSSTAPLNDFKIGLSVSPFIGYHLSEKLTIRLNPNWMLQQHNRMVQSVQSLNFHQIGLKLGVHFEL